MPKEESILAVDIGGDSLKMAEFSYPQEGGIVLESFAFTEYGGELKEDQLLESLSQAFKATLAEHHFVSKKVHLSISGQSAFIRFVKLPPVGEEEARVRQLVEYEARQNVPFPMSEVVWDYQLRRGVDDDAEIEVMFVVIKNDLIDEITKIVEEAGKEVILIEVAPTSCYNSARANEIGENDCEMILNIGGRCSSLVFIDSGRFFVRTIPIAGHSVTQQIAKEFGIPFADAEELKRRHGFVALGGAYEEPDSEVAATVSKIVRNVMTRLHGEINRSINVYRSQQKGKKPSKLYLAGGSSVMAFTPRFFSEKLRIPVEYFNPFQVVSLSENIDKEELAEVAHMFSEVIGLGLRYITVCPIEISLMPDNLKKQHELKQKIPYFYASCATIVLCLLITLWGMDQQRRSDLEKKKLAEKEIGKTSKLLSSVKTSVSSLKKIENSYEKAGKILAERKKWVDLLDELQKALPDQMWLTRIKGVGSIGAAPRKSSPAAPMGGGLFPVFTPTHNRPAARNNNTGVTEIGYIEVDGHSLKLPHSPSYEEMFKDNLVKSPLFTDDKEDIRTTDFTTARGNNNVTSFTMKIKLKEPIKK